jgi:phospholipid/cholesterol/gamma-HCH transport system substrate-binding protein
MLVNIHHDSKREHLRLLVAGTAFLAVIALLIGLSIAIYQKTFERDTMITIKADRAGLQLAKFGDVRVNGVLVGQVRAVEQDGEEAQIEVALDPSAAEEIPRNVDVEILPTTLFGQKYIAFVDPENPAEESLQDGDEIPSDRVETNVELNRILAELFPLLRAVQPAELNKTLNALATALEGRGEQLGHRLDELEAYLGEIDDALPTLRQDLIKLASVADTYDLAAPDLIAVLRNLTVTARTVVEKRRDLDVFFSDLGGLADTSTRVLKENEQNIIQVGKVTEPFLKLLAIYSPEFPCLLKGAARYAPLLSKTFEGNEVKQFLELGTNQYRNYDERDLPRYGEVGHGPWCSGLPNPPVPIGPVDLDEGSDISANSNLPGSQDGATRASGDSQRAAPSWATSQGMASGYAGSKAEQTVLNALLAAESGRPADAYGALGSLVYGPVVRGGGSS